MNVLVAIFQLVMAFFFAIPQILAPIPANIFEASYFEEWSAEQEYTEDYAVVIEKEADKDFVILNLADIQISDDENYYPEYEYAKAMINKLVEEQKPDLITLTGDNAWDTVAYVTLVNFVDSLGIPWAPVMGNHDGQGCISEFWCGYLFDEAENCLWKFGPKDMGYGNYIINIEENGEVIHTLFMMDTHDDGEWTVDGQTVSGYDHLWDNQIEWYEWAVKGIEAKAGKPVESSVFIHIPVFEVREVWNEYYEGHYCASCDDLFTAAQLKNGKCPACAGEVTLTHNKEGNLWTGEYADKATGIIHETPCPGAVNNHFTDKMLELGSTKNVMFGHDHVCNASINYEGIQLTYSLKLGYGCYYEDGLMGGTTLTINSDGNAQYAHHFCG